MLIGIAAIGLIIFWLGSRKPSPNVGGLSVSAPTFASFTNAEGVFNRVSLIVSNGGPSKLDFGVTWYEWRNGKNLKLLASSVTRGNGYVYGQFGSGKMISIPSRGTFTLTLNSGQNGLIRDPLFCAEIDWLECSSLRRRLGVSLDDWFKRAFGLFNFVWESRFWKGDPNGSVFTSNIRVEDYFQLISRLRDPNETFQQRGTNYVEIAADLAFQSFRAMSASLNFSRTLDLVHHEPEFERSQK
jgi:hypothetical protein